MRPHEQIPEGGTGWLRLPEEVDAFVARGRGPGPLVLVTAGVHGDEYEGPAAVAGIASRMGRDEAAMASLKGTLIAIPVVNPMAWRAAQRTSPADGLNLARTFPGNPGGSATERLAAAIFEIAAAANALIDLHSGGVEYLFAPLAGFYGEPAAGNPSFDAARRFGLPYLWQLPPTAGVLSNECSKRGIPSVGCEYLGAGQLSGDGIRDYIRGIFSCLALWGLCRGREPLPPGGEVMFGDWIAASAEGVFRARCALGEPVAAGDALAEILDERGTARQCFTAPYAGKVLGLRSKAYIRANDWGVLIGRSV